MTINAHSSPKLSLRLAFTLPVLFILLAASIGLWIAPQTGLAVRRGAILIIGVLVFVLFSRIARSPVGLKRASTLILLMGVFAGALSLVVTDWGAGDLAGSFPALSSFSHRFPLLFEPPGTGVPNPAAGANPRMVSGSMALFLPLALALAFFSHDRKASVFGALSLPVLFLPLLLSQSPQGLLAAFLGMCACLTFFRSYWLLVLAAALAAFYFTWMQAWLRLPDALLQRLEYGVASRLRVWSAAVSMLQDHALLGIGLNSFPVVFPSYSSYPDAPAHAHNLFLQTTLDYGVLGLLALLALLAAGFSAAWRLFHASKDPFHRAILAGLGAGLAAFVGYGLFDSMTLGNVPALAVWAMLGSLAGGFSCQPSELKAHDGMPVRP